jgi:hypothetical protein
MGLFDWLRGKPEPSLDVTFNPPPGSKPFGVDKPISECTDEDIQASREALWKACADGITGWRYDAGSDHKSTLFELAVDGMEADTRDALPPVPEELKLRCLALPISATHRSMEQEDDPPRRSVAYLALAREELESFCDAIYSKKTTKAQTKGRCYFCGFRHNVPSEPGQFGAAHFLQHTNALTRQVVLGEELAANFEQRTGRNGITSQQWIEQVLRPKVLK